MSHYIITIGREYGSRGLTIGKKLAKELGIKCYDKEIVELSAERKNMKASYLEDYDESMDTKIENNFILKVIRDNARQDKLFNIEAEIIKEIANRESCIIIGRCSDYILRDKDNAMHVFIYAPHEAKYNYAANEYGLTREATERMIIQADKARHDYYKRYTKSDRGDRLDKHILIDSSFVGIDGTVAVLKEMAIRKFGLEEL